MLAGIMLAGYLAKERSEMWIALVVAFSVLMVLVSLFQKAELQKVVTSNGLYFKWRPWQNKFRFIEKENIKSMVVRKGPAVQLGLGWLPGYGRYHNASRGKGVQLNLVNGERIFFSSSETGQFEHALEQIVSHHAKRRMSEF